MGIIQKQNLTLGLSEPDGPSWESTPQSADADNTLLVLGVLTFALQLCFVLFFTLRSWRFDKKVQAALTHPDAANKLIALPVFHRGISDQLSYSPYNNAAADSPPAKYVAAEKYEYKTVSTGCSIPWDLVQ